MATDPLAPLADLPPVTAAVQRAREAVDALLTNRVLRRRSPDVSAESALRGAWASTVLDGAQVSLDDVRSGLAIEDELVQGALRVQAALPTLTDTWSRAPRQALARLHTVAAAHVVDEQQLGRPVSAQAAERLDLLAEVVTSTRAPAVVVAAVVHGEVLGLEAFGPMSGLVARGAARLALIEGGLDPKSLVVPEVGHLELRAEYEQALAGYRAGTDVPAWVQHCADAIAAGAREASAICEAISRG